MVKIKIKLVFIFPGRHSWRWIVNDGILAAETRHKRARMPQESCFLRPHKAAF